MMTGLARQSLREEISDLKTYIGGLPQALRAGPYGETYRGRLRALLDELAVAELASAAHTARRPAMDLRVSTAADDHRLPAQFLGELLQGWQGLVSALGQAAAGRPTSRGSIPLDVMRQTTLDVVAFAEGSFVARMVLEELDQTTMVEADLGTAAFLEFEKLWAAGNGHHELTLLMHRLKGRVLSSYGQLLQLLLKANADLKVAFAEPNVAQLRHVHLSRERVASVLQSLASVGSPEETREETIIGWLNAAHRRTGTFELDLGQEGTVTGRIASDDVLEGLVIGRLYRCDVIEAVTKNPLTGEFESSFSLVKATPHAV